MKYVFIIFLGLFFAVPTPALAKINVFACEPEWAALAKEIGGGYIEAYSATTATQDPHHIRAKPSLIAKMRRADLVICSGADLEVGWLPLLLHKAGNETIQVGSEFYLMAADFVPVLEKLKTVDRSMGDVHPSGNPHVHLNPHNLTLVANALNERLKKLDHSNAQALQSQYDDFIIRWKKAISHWEERAKPLKGKHIITHHKSWTYLIDWLGLELLDTLEPKPGIPPTGSHLESLLQKIKTQDVSAIIRTSYDPDEASEWLSEKTNIPSLKLAYTVGGSDKADDLFTLYEQMMTQLSGVITDEQ